MPTKPITTPFKDDELFGKTNGIAKKTSELTNQLTALRQQARSRYEGLRQAPGSKISDAQFALFSSPDTKTAVESNHQSTISKLSALRDILTSSTHETGPSVSSFRTFARGARDEAQQILKNPIRRLVVEPAVAMAGDVLIQVAQRVTSLNGLVSSTGQATCTVYSPSDELYYQELTGKIKPAKKESETFAYRAGEIAITLVAVGGTVKILRMLTAAAPLKPKLEIRPPACEAVKLTRNVDVAPVIDKTTQIVKPRVVHVSKAHSNTQASYNVPNNTAQLGPSAGRSKIPALLKVPMRDPIETYVRTVIRPMIDQSLTILSPKEQHVIKMRFGLTDGVERTSIEIAQHLNTSKFRVNQILGDGLRKLRDRHAKEYIRIQPSYDQSRSVSLAVDTAPADQLGVMDSFKNRQLKIAYELLEGYIEESQTGSCKP